MESGTRLGPYEILEQLGAGGMGEVWLAEDTRLHRKVAIKVLPEQFAADPERLARFEQEARAAAALNHPHIAAVFDIGVEGEGEDRTHYIVQEYLEGRTLREVLASGAFALPEALMLGIEIAEALRAAHRAGVVHRDLKPDNIFVSNDGHAKVLDFGLAKLTEVGGAAVGNESMSPTVLGTQAGAVMGTAGYMSPEQAQGEEVDHRADLFSFGCVLYEMATGKQPFAGSNVYDTLSRIVDREPTSVTECDASLPSQLQWVVAKCLAKAPAARYQGAADLAVDLRSLSADVAAGRATPASPPSASASVDNTALRPLVPVAAAALVVGALASWALLQLGGTPVEDQAVRRFELAVPEGRRLTFTTHPIAISPDGENLVTLAIDAQERWLELRPLDQLEAREIPGTRGVHGYPFFSPDGRWLAFVMHGNIMKVSLAGEPPQTVCPVDSFDGATWTDDGRIVFVDDGVLYVVPAVGGTPQPVPANSESDSMQYSWPAALPGSTSVLAVTEAGAAEAVVVVDLPTGRVTPLVADATSPTYLPSGHLVYARGGFLFAAPFDVGRGALTGAAFPALEDIHMIAGASAHYAVATDGTLVYAPARGNANSGVNGQLIWVDSKGVETELPVPTGPLEEVALSPDGSRLAVQAGEAPDADIHLIELALGGARQRFTATGYSMHPVWSPDGEWVIYSAREGNEGLKLYRRRSDSSDVPELLLTRPGVQRPNSVSADGGLVFFSEEGAGEPGLHVLNLATGTAEVVLADPDAEGAEISPDGRALAYSANYDGPWQVYLLDLETGGRRVVSVDGGRYPKWSPDGGTLYYRGGRGDDVGFVANDVTFDEGLEISPSRRLFDLDHRAEGGGLIDVHGVHPDGERFLAIRSLDAGAAAAYRLVVTVNWFEDIRQRAAAVAGQ